MSLIPDYMRAGMLAQAESTLTDSATVERRSDAIDDAGHVSTAWAVVASGVPARWLPRKRTPASDSMVAGQSMDKVFGRVALKLGTDVREGDRLVSNGLRYPVLQIMARPTDMFWIEVEVIAPSAALEASQA